MAPLKLKRSVDDIWPMRNKNVLVRVDFNVAVKNGSISNDRRIRAALPTIRRIVDQGGKAVLLTHLGRPTGHKYDRLRNDEETKRRYLKVWADEAGTGKTTFFAICTGDEKKQILSWSSAAAAAESVLVDEGTGKTDLFASLPDEEKKTLLDRFQAESRGEQYQLRAGHDFPQLRQYNGFEEELSLRPIAVRLGELLNEPSSSSPLRRIEVKFAEDCMNATADVESLLPGQVLLLENVRFYSNHNSPDENERLVMATRIARYGDYYVNDAFGTTHRESATMTGVPKVLGHGCAGYLMRREIEALTDVIDAPPRPLVAIVGGAKVSDKLISLEHILKQIDCLIIGGALAFTILQTKNYRIGNSFHESGQSFVDKYGENKDVEALTRSFLDKARASGVEVYLPIDHVCHTSCEPTDEPLVTDDANIPDGYMGLDVGPKTIESFIGVIKNAGTAVCNGTMGVYEIPTFATGSFSIIKAMADVTERGRLLSVVGGGSCARVAEISGHAPRISHVSSGGSASLDLFQGKVLPGLQALDDA